MSSAAFLARALTRAQSCRAQAMHGRRALRGPHVAAEAVGVVDRHVDRVLARIVHPQVLALGAVDRGLDQPLKQADAKVHVHHIVARIQIGEKDLGMRRFAPQPPRARLAPAKDLGIGEQVERRTRRSPSAQNPPRVQRALHQRQPAPRRAPRSARRPGASAVPSCANGVSSHRSARRRAWRLIATSRVPPRTASVHSSITVRSWPP